MGSNSHQPNSPSTRKLPSSTSTCDTTNGIVNDAWTKIEEEYPYHISFDAPAQSALRNQLGRLQTQMKTDVPSVHIDWFLATASTPPLYHDLLSLPLNG